MALVSSTKSGNLSDKWVLDSGCSFHISPYRDWFKAYNGGTIIFGNNAPCKVTGIGSIRLRTTDGRRLTLTRVQRVPALGKNMISLGALDDLGYNNGELSDKELSIYKGSNLVLEGIRRNTLHVFKGVTLSSFAVCASVINQVMINIWHIRLGHMGEKGMQLFSKIGSRLPPLNFVPLRVWKETQVKV